MATLSVQNPTLMDLAKATDPDGGIADIVEILNETNEVLDDMTWIEGNLTTGNRTSIRTGLPTPTWRKMYGGVQPDKGSQAQVDDIWDGIIDCGNNGIIGIPPLGVGSYLGFWERCAEDTQLQCGNIASTGCCNPASPFYSYWCTQDPTCTCDYNC